MIKRRYLGTALIVASVAMMGCSSDDDDDDGTDVGTPDDPGAAAPADPAAEYTAPEGTVDDIATIVTNSPDYSVLLAGLQAADLASTFVAGMDDSGTVYTVFAPDDNAFGAAGLDADTIANLEGLGDVLQLHVVSGAYDSEQLAANTGRALTSLNGNSLLIGGGIEEDEAAEAEGGSLLDELDELGEEIEEEVTGDVDRTPLTITAGGDGATVVAPDIFATNGIIHGINAVLALPAPTDDGTGDEGDEGGDTGGGELGDNALSQAIAADAELSTFATVLASEAVSIDSAFDNAEETWTVFAPINSALEGVTLPDGEENTTIGYHIANAGGGNVFTAEDLAGIVASGGMLTMTQGGATTIGGDLENGLTINGFNIVGEPIEVANGLIHKIDGVLVPTGLTAEPPPPAPGDEGDTDDGSTDDGTVDETVDDAGETVEDAGDTVEDAAEDAGDTVEDAAEDTGDAVEDAGDEVEEALP